MGTRWAFVAALLVGFVAWGTARGGEADEARKKAERVSSYVALAETVARVGIQVGGMVEHHPYDKAVVTYAREIGRLHAKLYEKLTPPEGAEKVHKRFKDAVVNFAMAAEAHHNADYATAHKHRKKSLQEFALAILEVGRLRKDGVIPGYAPASGPRK